MSADVAGVVRTGSSVERGVLGRCFGIRFHGEALHGLQSRGDGFLIGLGAPHFRIKTLINLTQSGIVRTDARHRVFGILRGRGTGWPGYFLVSVHDSGRRDWVILAQADQLKRGNLNGGKIRFSLPLPSARRCKLRDDSARRERFAARCGRPQGRRSAESEDYAHGRRRR